MKKCSYSSSLIYLKKCNASHLENVFIMKKYFRRYIQLKVRNKIHLESKNMFILFIKIEKINLHNIEVINNNNFRVKILNIDFEKYSL